MVDYWVEPRVYINAPPSGWGSDFEEEDRMIQEVRKKNEFVGMIGSNTRSIRIECSKEKEERSVSHKPKSYTFHIPIATANYKATPFNYQVVNHAAIVGGLT